MGDIFLSASVPNRRSSNFVKDADTVAITSAVTALVYLALGRKRIVWGGHPAITPMVASVAHSLDTDYTEWTKLYQSSHFLDHMPEENEQFSNIVVTPAGGDLQESLFLMRHQMFEDNVFDCAIFIGGMSGIFEEYELFSSMQGDVPCYPIASTGGAAEELLSMSSSSPISSDRLSSDLDYISLLREITKIGFDAERQRMLRDSATPLKDGDV